VRKVENALVRVYIRDGFWETGVLRSYFQDLQPDLHTPMFFRSTNCDFDVDTRCYIFKLPELGREPPVLRDVFIPERFVVGLAVKQAADEEYSSTIGRVGFPIPSNTH
jgi:hypothetical protein